MGRKQRTKQTIFVSTPISLESIRKLRDAGFLTIIVHDELIHKFKRPGKSVRLILA